MNAMERSLARVEIRDTIERYFSAIDRADKARLAGCFTADARYESAGGTLDLTGAQAIAARLASGRFAHATHLRGNTAIDFTEQGAIADTSAVAILVRGPGEMAMMRGLRYLDTLLETGERWLIDHRRHITLWQSDLPSVPPFVP